MYRCALLGFPMESLDREVRGRLFETLIPWVTKTCSGSKSSTGHVCPMSMCPSSKRDSFVSSKLIQPGVEAPDFTLESIDGEQVTLSSFRGRKTVVLIEWATWCDYCKVEVPETSGIVEELSARGVVVLASNFMEEPTIVKEFAKVNSLKMTVLLDRDRQVAKAFRMTYIPVVAIIDIDGTLRHIGKGVGAEELKKLLAPIIVNPSLIEAESGRASDK